MKPLVWQIGGKPQPDLEVWPSRWYEQVRSAPRMNSGCIAGGSQPSRREAAAGMRLKIRSHVTFLPFGYINKSEGVWWPKARNFICVVTFCEISSHSSSREQTTWLAPALQVPWFAHNQWIIIKLAIGCFYHAMLDYRFQRPKSSNRQQTETSKTEMELQNIWLFVTLNYQFILEIAADQLYGDQFIPGFAHAAAKSKSISNTCVMWPKPNLNSFHDNSLFSLFWLF